MSMNWKALHDGNCPRCGLMLEDHGENWSDYLFCTGSHCLFKINRVRLKEILESKPKPKPRFQAYTPPSEDENLSDLNNL